MQRRNRKPHLSVEGLEPLRLMTTMVPIYRVAASSLHQSHPTLTSISGTYLVTQANPDFGHTTRLQGTASLGGLTSVPFTGNLNGTGFIARGRAGGTLTFASGAGSLVVTLTGPVQSGFAGLPSQFKYVVTKSVGNLKGVRGAGAATLALQSDGSFTLNFLPGIGKKH